LQITASSVTGKFGADVQQMCEELLLADQVSAIASDCHNLKGRTPDLLAGYNKVKAIKDEYSAKHLVIQSPSELIAKNEYIKA